MQFVVTRLKKKVSYCIQHTTKWLWNFIC